MCGIWGLYKLGNNCINDNDRTYSKKVLNKLSRRGPDAQGVWQNNNCILLFRRLSIIDLTKDADQPMISKCGNFILIYNGELYNYKTLRDELLQKGYTFHTKSDTEVVLNALIDSGEAVLEKFNGMFSLAFYNIQQKTVLISRDHVGMKPLYYAIIGGKLVFGSQLNVIQHYFKSEELNYNTLGLDLYLATGSFPVPHTIFREIKQLTPGTWKKYFSDGNVKTGIHFDLFDCYQMNQHTVPSNEDLYEVLSQSVNRHLIGDVAIGTYLSGGIDSSLISGLGSELMDGNINTYTFSIPGSKFDEVREARAVANHLNVNQIIIQENDDPIENTVNDFIEAYSEPLGDYSALPLMMISKIAKNKVKVLLSGDGADELFFGYNRMETYLNALPYYKYPYLLRRIRNKLIKISGITYRNKQELIFDKHVFAPRSVLTHLESSFEELTNEFHKPLVGKKISDDIYIKLITLYRYFNFQLKKIDMGSMFHSIETRVPFADKEMIKLVIALNASDVCDSKYKNRKLPLKNLYKTLYPNLSGHLNKKKGFTIDIANLMKYELKDLYNDILQSSSPFKDYLHLGKLRKTLNSEEKVTLDPIFQWTLFSLQAWYIYHATSSLD